MRYVLADRYYCSATKNCSQVAVEFVEIIGSFQAREMFRKWYAAILCALRSLWPVCANYIVFSRASIGVIAGTSSFCRNISFFDGVWDQNLLEICFVFVQCHTAVTQHNTVHSWTKASTFLVFYLVQTQYFLSRWSYREAVWPHSPGTFDTCLRFFINKRNRVSTGALFYGWWCCAFFQKLFLSTKSVRSISGAGV